MNPEMLRVHVRRDTLTGWCATCLFATGVRPGAYPVPWRVLPGGSRSLVIQHAGREPLTQVRVLSHHAGAAGVSLPTRVLPGDCLAISPPPGVESGSVVVRWVHPDGTELLWPAAW